MQKTIECERAEIDGITAAWYAAFTNKGRSAARLGSLFDLAVPRCVITKASRTNAESYSLEEFVAPRAKWLSDGSLVGFEESEVSETTTIRETIAHRDSRYRKSGRQHGQLFSAYGRTFFQLVKVSGTWKVCALLFMDEVAGTVGNE
jgi:hypothetical protein